MKSQSTSDAFATEQCPEVEQLACLQPPEELYHTLPCKQFRFFHEAIAANHSWQFKLEKKKHLEAATS